MAIGSEGRGVSRPVLDARWAALKIPVQGCCEPLNATVATSAMLWED